MFFIDFPANILKNHQKIVLSMFFFDFFCSIIPNFGLMTDLG